MKKLILAAALIAPLAGPALAQVGDVGGGAGNSSPAYSTSTPREFTARRLIETRDAVEAPAAQADRNAVPSSAF
jgi:hypothetical protein